MHEAEVAGVELQWPLLPLALGIEHIAPNRMTHPRQVNPNLVSSPGFEGQTEHAPVAMP